MKYEVLMSAYNDAEVLKLTLEGFLRQSDMNFSICIADDGSGPDVKSVVDIFLDRGLNIRHIWQEDFGFRRGMILNKAIASSEAERLIFVDSDGIPHTDFIKDHKKYSERGRILVGPRVYLKEKITRKIKQGHLDISYIDNVWRLLFFSIFRMTRKPEQAFYYPEFFCHFFVKSRFSGLMELTLA